jgi:hypothetical protein
MSLSYKITAYLGREPDWRNEVTLQDDGEGAYIRDWNAVDKVKPSNETLDTFEVAAQTLEDDWTAQEYARKRRDDFPDWHEQLEKIADDGLTKWKSEMLDPVKTKWPKDNSGPV